jgi:hypothetical protein
MYCVLWRLSVSYFVFSRDVCPVDGVLVTTYTGDLNARNQGTIHETHISTKNKKHKTRDKNATTHNASFKR